jgi:hypothetical protein
MPRSPSEKRKASYVPIIIAAVVLVGLIAGYFYLRSGPPEQDNSPASPEAKAYVKNLELSDVGMKAAENFMQQQIVEVIGKITNKGNRTLDSVDVYCIFYGVDGREVHREKVPIVIPTGKPFAPQQTRDFRLPFDTLPPNWNQTMPRLVVAQIKFSH